MMIFTQKPLDFSTKSLIAYFLTNPNAETPKINVKNRSFLRFKTPKTLKTILTLLKARLIPGINYTNVLSSDTTL